MAERVLRFIAIALLLCTPAGLAAQSLDFDAATIADLNAAFARGALTSERLVQLCLARIDAYDRKGPALRAIITLNPKAIETARALDAERKGKGPRSPLHGIPIVLKDNYDTLDMPTTGGSLLLEGSIPPDDAFMVKKLRAAGAIILAKVNLSEFASGGARSSIGGQSRNPHDLTRTPSGSSGGTGIAVAAGYAPIGLGTDTGGFDPRPLSLERHRRSQTDAWPAEPRRHHPAGAFFRHGRPDGAERVRRRSRAQRDDRNRPGRCRHEEKRR